MPAKPTLLLSIALLLAALAMGNPFLGNVATAPGEAAPAPLAAPVPVATPVGFEREAFERQATAAERSGPVDDAALAGLEPALRSLVTGTRRDEDGAVVWLLRDGRTVRRDVGLRGAESGWLVLPATATGTVHDEDEAPDEAGERADGKR
jgi:hypothetical protein